MINYKIFTKHQCRSSLLASVALLLGGALSFSSAVQAQETIISLGIGAQLGYGDPDGPNLVNLATSSSAGQIESMNPNSTIFAVGVRTENRGANNDFHFAYLYGKDELKSNPDSPVWSGYPRSYFQVPRPFRIIRGAEFHNNARRVTRVETGLHFEYRNYYSTELISRSGVTFSAYGGFALAANYLNANMVYETSSGSAYAETNQTELAFRGAPMVGTEIQYSFANGHYLKSNINMSSGGIGYVSIKNEVVKGDNLNETYDGRDLANRSGLDAQLASSNGVIGVIYGTDQFEVMAGTKSFRAALDFKTHMYFEVGFKF